MDYKELLNEEIVDSLDTLYTIEKEANIVNALKSDIASLKNFIKQCTDKDIVIPHVVYENILNTVSDLNVCIDYVVKECRKQKVTEEAFGIIDENEEEICVGDSCDFNYRARDDNQIVS